MNAPGMRAGRVIGAQLNAQAAALGQMTIDDSFIGAMILMLAFPARFRDAADVAYVAATADFRPGAPICPIVRTSEGFHRRKRQLTRRCAALDILPPGEALGLARLMHACLRTFVGHALYPDQRVNLGDLAQAVGIRGGSHESPSGASARRTLNALAAHHFEGISFATLVESLDPEEYVRVFGSLLLRSLWGRPEPPPIWVAELPVFENRRQLVRFVLRKLRERCSVAIRRPRRRQP
jgi:hypothetical protein